MNSECRDAKVHTPHDVWYAMQEVLPEEAMFLEQGLVSEDDFLSVLEKGIWTGHDQWKHEHQTQILFILSYFKRFKRLSQKKYKLLCKQLRACNLEEQKEESSKKKDLTFSQRKDFHDEIIIDLIWSKSKKSLRKLRKNQSQYDVKSKYAPLLHHSANENALKQIYICDSPSSQEVKLRKSQGFPSLEMRKNKTNFVFSSCEYYELPKTGLRERREKAMEKQCHYDSNRKGKGKSRTSSHDWWREEIKKRNSCRSQQPLLFDTDNNKEDNEKNCEDKQRRNKTRYFVPNGFLASPESIEHYSSGEKNPLPYYYEYDTNLNLL